MGAPPQAPRVRERVSRHGDRYTVFDTPHGCRVGVLICYDNNIVENARATALLGAEMLLAPHQTGGCNSVSPRAMKPVDPAIWERRHEDPAASEPSCAAQGAGWLMRWLPSRAHDNGMFLLFSNGVGPDDDEIRTGNAMVLDPYGEMIAETREADDAMVVADLDASLLPTSSGRRGCARAGPSSTSPLRGAPGRSRTRAACALENEEKGAMKDFAVKLTNKPGDLHSGGTGARSARCQHREGCRGIVDRRGGAGAHSP